MQMENRRQLTGHCAAVVGAVSFNYLKLCRQTDLQLKGGTVPFSSFFFYFAPGRDAPAVADVVFCNESGA
jgi:hypothetical protein